MHRRDFFKALSGGLAASAALPLLPVSAPPLPQTLAFHPDAFALVMRDLPAPQCSRMDVIYGYPKVRIGDTIRVRLPQRYQQ